MVKGIQRQRRKGQTNNEINGQVDYGKNRQSDKGRND